MNEASQSKLILIVDDDEEFREELIPAFLEPLQAAFLKAADLSIGLKSAREHGPASEAPLDLIVFDMHMPIAASDSGEVSTKAGWIGVVFAHRVAGCSCPMVVFTAYDNYDDCILAARAGAVAYVSKKRNTEEWSPDKEMDPGDKLLLECQRALGIIDLPDEEAWYQANVPAIRDRHPGKYVLIVPEEIARNAGTDGEVIDGRTILADDTREALVDLIIDHPLLLEAHPEIQHVP